MEVYWDWYKEQFGVSPLILGADGNALKKLITYYLELAKQDEELAVHSWGATLRNWDVLPTYWRDKVSLRQILSEINTIIIKIRARVNGSNNSKISKDFEDKIARDIRG